MPDSRTPLAADNDLDSAERRRDRALVNALVSGALGRLLAVSFGFVSVSVAARELGDVRYGVVATLGTIVGVAGFADLGVGSGLLTRLSTASSRPDTSETRELVSTAVVTLGALGLLFAVAGSLTAFLLPWRSLLGAQALGSTAVSAAVVALACSIGLGIAGSVGPRILLALQKGTLTNVWATVAAAASLAAVAGAAYMQLPMWAFVVAGVGVPSAVYSIQTIWVLRRTHAYLAPSMRLVSRHALKSLAGLSGLFLALNIAIAFAYETDSVVVASIKGAKVAAVFAVSLRMFNIVTGLFAAGTQQMWPAMGEALARGNTAWVRSRFRTLLLGTVVLAGAMCLALLLAGRPLVRAWVGRSLEPSLALLIAFSAWSVYSLAMSLCSYVLHAAAIVRAQVLMALSMAAVNLVLSVVLTMRFGIVGPLYGSLIAHVVCAGIPTVILVRRTLGGEASSVLVPS